MTSVLHYFNSIFTRTIVSIIHGSQDHIIGGLDTTYFNFIFSTYFTKFEIHTLSDRKSTSRVSGILHLTAPRFVNISVKLLLDLYYF